MAEMALPGNRSRAATGGKAAKAWSLAGFCEIENGSGGAPVKWLPLWHRCIPKIYHGGHEEKKLGPKGQV